MRRFTVGSVAPPLTRHPLGASERGLDKAKRNPG
jgi:hypothetical protein